MNDEQVDSFTSLFPGPPGDQQREARKVRIKAERRAQLTEKQRRRGGNAVRTTQINFRCSPAFRELAAGLSAFDRTFGSRDEVDPVRHLIGTAAGWGGLPTSEATYVGVNPSLPVGRYHLRVGDVPVDAFWSISVYNAEGYFEPNPLGVYSVNSVTGVRDADGSITVRFGDHGEGAPNTIPITEGWNYLVRLYRPRPEIKRGEWTFPEIASAG